jgi:hypothetical protein
MRVYAVPAHSNSLLTIALVRQQHRRDKLTKDLKDRGVPVTDSLNLTHFLVDVGTIGDWSLEGLPTDPLSVQNGILVTRSSRCVARLPLHHDASRFE